MGTKEKIDHLQKLCKGDVSIFINEHRLNGYGIREWWERDDGIREDISPELLTELEEKDVVYWVQAYPNTSVGFYRVFHWDLDVALDQMIEQLNQE